MGGLLKQLQKRKAGLADEASSIVIRVPAAPGAEPPIFELKQIVEEGSAADADGLPAKSAATPAAGEEQGSRRSSTPSSGRIVRRMTQHKSDSAPSANEAPAWLKAGSGDEKKTNPQLEALITAAERLLSDPPPQGKAEAADAVKNAVALAADTLRDEVRLSRRVLEQAEEELVHLLSGKGPLQPLYDDQEVTDLFVDDHKTIRVIRRSRPLETPFKFRSASEYELFAASLLHGAGHALDARSPIVECVLDDQWQSRVSALHQSIVRGEEPRLAIHVPRPRKVAFYDAVHTKILPPTLASWLADLVGQHEANILVAGPARSGKTLMLSALLSAVGGEERLITIEQAPELSIPAGNIESLVARPKNGSAEGEMSARVLLQAALRRAPDRIALGSIGPEEAALFLQTLELGIAGSMASLCAESALDALWRLLDYAVAGMTAPQESMIRRISRSVHLILTMRNVDGTPCMIEVSEVDRSSALHFEVVPLIQYAGTKEGKRVWRLADARSYWLKRTAELGQPLTPGPALQPFQRDTLPGQAQNEQDS